MLPIVRLIPKPSKKSCNVLDFESLGARCEAWKNQIGTLWKTAGLAYFKGFPIKSTT